MESPQAIAIIFVLSVTLIIFNALISRDIFYWVPLRKKQIDLYLLVWCLPVIGFLLANKLGNLGWFSKKRSDGEQSAISGGFMEADSIFNPGMKHQIEMHEKQAAETREIAQDSDSQESDNKHY